MIEKWFSRRSLTQRFLIASFPIFLFGTLFIGTWVGKETENSIAQRLGGVTALYIDSFIAPRVQDLTLGKGISDKARADLSGLVVGTALGKKVIAFKLWDLHGRILYSKDEDLIGKAFPVEEGLAEAYAGNISSEISDLEHLENQDERRYWSRLIETYVPIRADNTGEIIAVAEFYQTTEELERTARQAQLHSWVLVASIFLCSYLVLFGMVSKGSNTIEAQRAELQVKIAELTALNQQNELLNENLRRAAERTAALNESFLRRISADLHDGPGQDLGLALMRLETLAERADGSGRALLIDPEEFETIRLSVRSAMQELRSISAGLSLPDIAQLSANEVASLAVQDYQAKTGAHVALDIAAQQRNAPLPVKIALYRVLQESLTNSFKHGGELRQRVRLDYSRNHIELAIQDHGKGFDPGAALDGIHLGLKGMRERIELLGGTFKVSSAPGCGCAILTTLPLDTPGADYA
jgi:signal transduction histidine kinase